jgi:hypothetical protein
MIAVIVITIRDIVALTFISLIILLFLGIWLKEQITKIKHKIWKQ